MIAIENCRIVPIDRPVIERGAILIDGSRIRAIHDLRAERRLEKAQTVVDGTGLTAIPGMGQMHGHFSSYLHTMDTAPVNAQPDTLKAIQAVAFVLGPWTFFGHWSLVIRHSSALPALSGVMRNELNRPSAPTTPPTVNATRTLRSQGGR